jgi:hypothetical protein
MLDQTPLDAVFICTPAAAHLPVAEACLERGVHVFVEKPLADTLENAPKYVQAPSFEPGKMDFYPLAGKCQGPAVDLTFFETDNEYTRDFNGTSKTASKASTVFRGAYAGEGSNPGWQLHREIKVPPPPALRSVPEVIGVSRASGYRGATASVTLIGAYFDPGASVTVSGTGVTAGPVKVKASGPCWWPAWASPFQWE